MTEPDDATEVQLRKMFQAAAAQIHPTRPPPGTDAAPLRHSGPIASRLALGVTVVAVGAAAAFGVHAWGGSGGSSAPLRSSVPGSNGQVAVFQVPPGPSRLIPLSADVPVLTARLHSLGDAGAKVVVQGNTVVVQGGGPLPAPASFFVKVGHLSFRPVLCGAPAYTPSTGVAPNGTLPASDPQYQTSQSNPGVTPSSNGVGGLVYAHIVADPMFAGYQSTPGDDANTPSTTVLLPNDPINQGGPYPRFVLGPAQMEGGALIASAQAHFDRSIAGWIVEGTFTSSGAVQWDRATRADFHQYLAIDMDGVVLSAPLIQPTQTAFTSFAGKFQIAGAFTGTTARQLAALLESGPLPAPLVPG